MKRRISDRLVGYSLQSLRKDMLAGLVVGVIAIPLGMGFAIASGVKPEYGIYTTIIAGIIISMLGGSRFQIGGPTGAFIPVLLGIVVTYGYENLLIAGILAGIMLFLMGVFKMGSLVQYIPQSVTIGFTTGIAVTIFTGQLGNLFGLTDLKKHEYFIPNMQEFVTHLSGWNGYSLLTALICFVLILLVQRYLPKVPGSLVGLVGSSILAAVLFPGQLPTIGSAYGEIPRALPSFHLPEFDLENWLNMLQPAFVIAMLGSIESLLTAVVADGMTGDRHDSNRELRAQGIANIVTPLFGGIPATGAIARTATNIRSGAVSKLSGIIHGVVVLLVLLLFAPYASAIPLAAMAPVLMLVAWNMSERKQFAHILATRTGDSIIIVVTFLLTVFTNLTIAVEVGLLIAVLLFVKRSSDTVQVTQVLPDLKDTDLKMSSTMVTDRHDCDQITIYTINGPLFFGAARVFNGMMDKAVERQAKVVIIRMASVPYMDVTGASMLRKAVKRLKHQGAKVLISGIQAQPREVLERVGVYDEIGAAQFFVRTFEAVSYATTLVDPNRCAECRNYAFQECSPLDAVETI
ncbi:SulP family inorganic anion transporter [Paenibacillus marinisediminis]